MNCAGSLPSSLGKVFPSFIILALSMSCVAEGKFVYRGNIVEGKTNEHQIELQFSEASPVSGAKVKLFVDFRSRSACSYSPHKNAPYPTIWLTTDKDGRVQETLWLHGTVFQSAYLNVCVKAAGYPDYEYSVNLTKDSVGGPSSPTVQVVYLTPSRVQ